MIGRAIWIIALAVLGLGTTGLQLDRQSRVTPALAPYVPEPFRAFAETRLTASALANDEHSAALTHAQNLVRRRPMPAQNLRLLAAAQFQAGQVASSALSIQHAARRGWRDPLAQHAMMGIAMDAGDEKEAAHRFVALMLQKQTSDEVLVDMGKRLFAANSDSSLALTDLVSGTTRWHPAFVQRGLNVLPADIYVETLSEANQRGIVFDCNQLQFSMQSFAKREGTYQHAAALEELIRRQCR